MPIAFAKNLSLPLKSSLVMAIACLCVCGGPQVAFGQAGDKVEGAIWRFSMKPKVEKLKPLRGRFRLHNNRIYQKADPNEKEFNKLVGTSIQGPKKKRDAPKAKVTFTDLRAVDKQLNSHTGIKGTVLMKMEKPGVGTGTLVDSEGRHWDFRCTRIQE